MSVLIKKKTMSKSKKNSKSRKQFKKSRKHGSKTRKMRGGSNQMRHNSPIEGQLYKTERHGTRGMALPPSPSPYNHYPNNNNNVNSSLNIFKKREELLPRSDVFGFGINGHNEYEDANM